MLKTIYYSYDDHHNKPYISGPFTEEEFRDLIGDLVKSQGFDLFLEVLLEDGVAADDFGDTWRLHNPEDVEAEAIELLIQARVMREGGHLPLSKAEEERLRAEMFPKET